MDGEAVMRRCNDTSICPASQKASPSTRPTILVSFSFIEGRDHQGDWTASAGLDLFQIQSLL